MPREVFGLGAGGFRRDGEGMAFVGPEALGHRGLGIAVAERRGANEAQVLVEGDQAEVEGKLSRCREEKMLLVQLTNPTSQQVSCRPVISTRTPRVIIR